MGELGGDHLRIDRVDAAHPRDIDREVAGDREQPGRDSSLALVVCAGVPPHARESLLRDLLRYMRLADDGQRQTVDPPLEATDERGRGIGIAGREASEQCLVGWLHIRNYVRAGPPD